MNKSPEDIQIISNPNNFSFVESWYDISNESHFWMRWRITAFLNQATKMKLPLKKDLKGIEVGCGHGILRKQIEQITNWSVDGTDLNLKALKRNPKGRGKLYLYDITEKNKEFLDKYDFLLLYDVLEHVENTQLFLSACQYHIKHGGLMYINVPALQILHSPYDIAAGHIKRYTKKTLSKELKNAGLKILDIRYWGFSLIPLLVIRKMIISPKQSHDDIIKKGFKPPTSQINFMLKILMSLETSLMKAPPFGTSIMAIAKKM